MKKHTIFGHLPLYHWSKGSIIYYHKGEKDSWNLGGHKILDDKNGGTQKIFPSKRGEQKVFIKKDFLGFILRLYWNQLNKNLLPEALKYHQKHNFAQGWRRRRRRRRGWRNALFLHCWNCDSLAVVVLAHFDSVRSRRHRESWWLFLPFVVLICHQHSPKQIQTSQQAYLFIVYLYKLFST